MKHLCAVLLLNWIKALLLGSRQSRPAAPWTPSRQAQRWRPTFERLEKRVTPSGVSWNQFNGNAQHTGISTVAAQPMDQILWQTSVNLQGSFFWHTGEPVFTPSDTVIVPVKVTSSGKESGTANFELEAFNGNTGALLWTATSDYVEPSYTWPPYQPVYDPNCDRVYFPGPGGTLYYISDPDDPGSAMPTPSQVAFYGTANYDANEPAYSSTIYIDTPLTVDNSGNVYFGFAQTGSNPSGINDGGVARVSATGAGAYELGGAAIQVPGGTGTPAIGSAPALSNDGSILYVAIEGSNGPNLVGLNAATLAPEYAVVLSVPNSGTGVDLIDISTAAPMVAPDGTVFMGVFADNLDGSRGLMTHYSADLATEYTPGAFGWDDTASIIPTSMVPSYTGTSPYLILTKYNNYVAGEVGSTGGDGVNEIAILDPYATETDPNNDPNPNLLVMKQILTVTSPTEDSDFTNDGYPDATREWCTNGTAVDPATDSVFINNEDGFSYRWNLATDSITQAVEITDGYGEPYTPTAIGPNGVVYAINGGTLFALGGYSNYTLTNVSSLTTSVAGQSITFTTTLASTSDGAVPAGSITYSYTSGANNPLNSTPVTLGTEPLMDGQATFTTSAFVGDHYHIIASYSGDTTDGYGAGSTTLVQVVLANPTTTVTSSASAVAVEANATLTATVNPDGAFFVPLGTVSFMDGATLLGTVALNTLDQSTSPSSPQVATFTTALLPAGSQSIRAVYSGDLNFAGGTSSPLTQFVSLISTATSLTDNGPSPTTFGQSVSFTVNVTGGVPDGEVVTLEDQSNSDMVVGTGTLSSGTANICVSNLSGGPHEIYAVYPGDATLPGSMSPDSLQTVVLIPSVASVVVNGDPGDTLAGSNSRVATLYVTFNEPVQLDSGAFTLALHNNVNVNGTPDSQAGTLPGGLQWSSSDNIHWTVTFVGSAGVDVNVGADGYITIMDGVYDLTIVATKVHSLDIPTVDMASSVTQTFWALFGGSGANDSITSGTIGDGNTTVSIGIGDFNAFASAFGSAGYSIAQGYSPILDVNGDGSIDVPDFDAFANSFGTTWQF